MESTLWSLILASGAGKRLVTPTGGLPIELWQPSLLEETLARVGMLTPLNRCVIVIDEAHREYISRCAPAVGAHIVAQPADRGTAAAVLYGLLSVLSTDPAAVVLITPVDHDVANPSLFLSAIRKAVRHVTVSDGVMLLGAAPPMAHTDLGWIATAPGGSPTGIRRVARFVEKPPIATAQQLMKLGSLLNTMVVAARAVTLLRLCRERVPDMTECFVGALTLPPNIRDAAVRAKYQALPRYDFSRHVLTGAAGVLVSRIPDDAGWSDLGSPDRLAEWLERRRDSRQLSPQRSTIGSSEAVEDLA